MFYTRKDIKVSFSRPKYETNGTTVKCTLKYKINVPAAYQDNRLKKDGSDNPNGCLVEFISDFGVHSAVGIANLNTAAGDKFDKKIGREIAESRAESNAYRQANAIVKKYVASIIKEFTNMAVEFDAKTDAVNRHNKEYAASIG